jgi:hypothetical protein
MITWPRSLRFERFNAGAWRAWGPWCVRQFQRGAVVLVGVFLGGVLVWVMASDVWEAHGQAQQALNAAQAQLPSQGAEPRLPDLIDPLAQESGPLWQRLPGRLTTDIGTELRQFLMAQGLQVASLRAMPDAMRGPLQSKTVAIRMTGAYADWAQAWQSLTESGPVLSMERMSVVPLAQTPGVQLDVVLRVWFKPDATHALTWPPGERRGLRTAQGPHAGAEVFALTASQEARPSPVPALVPSPMPVANPALSDDPLSWPVERIRLLGTWQQGAHWRAVLGVGALWVPVHLGQRVSQEGHKVAVIRREGVMLRTPQGQQVELGWTGGGR